MPSKLPPTPRPFKEALEFHRSRVAISDRDVKSVASEARMRALWASGLSKQASALELHRAIDEAIRNGTKDSQFRADYAQRVAANGGPALTPDRQNLIFFQNTGLAYANGRMQQMLDPDVLAERPIWMYPLGPHDDRTTSICLDLEGFMAEAESDVWQHIAPPNHFKERHLTLVSLSREDAEARGKIYEDPEESNGYPILDGQAILPDSGFDTPSQMLATDAKSLLDDFAKLLEEQDAKVAEDYELVALAEVDAELAIEFDVPAELDEETAWESMREATNMPDGLDSTIVEDVFGDGAIVNRKTFEAIFAGDEAAEALAGELPELLDDPLEVWFVPVSTDAGTVMMKRYLASFVDAEGETVWLWADQAPSGWIAQGGAASADELETKRKGYLALARTPRRTARKAA